MLHIYNIITMRANINVTTDIFSKVNNYCKHINIKMLLKINDTTLTSTRAAKIFPSILSPCILQITEINTRNTNSNHCLAILNRPETRIVGYLWPKLTPRISRHKSCI